MAGDRTAGQRLVTGDAVNTAARLEQTARTGEIVIGERTYDLVALALVDETDSPIWRADVRMAVARALGPDRREEAVTMAREALAFAERKGADVLAKAASELLTDLERSALSRSERRPVGPAG